MRTFSRYVAIGDSTTEGLDDPDGAGGYRGWADRLAEIIANAQAEPLNYANLGVRSLHLSEIRATQFGAAMAMQPDLLSIFGGANDILSVACDFARIRADLAAIFSEARSRNCTVVTFTMPDLSPINPFSRRLRGRMLQFNDIIREEAERYGALVMDFLQHPIIPDPRLFSEDRLHASELGHERLAAALAWRLGIEGADKSWADPFPEAAPRLRTREQLAADVEWARRYFRALAQQRHPADSTRLRTYRQAAGANPCAQKLVVSRGWTTVGGRRRSAGVVPASLGRSETLFRHRRDGGRARHP